MPPVIVTLQGGLRTLARRRGTGRVEVPVVHPRSVKDAVESAGVPHTEVGAVLVDAREVGWDTLLRGGEAVEVHPLGALPPDLVGLVRPQPPPRPLRVVADVHLGTLARRLRVLGVDTRWRNDADDDQLLEIALTDGRVLLTRDRGLLMRRAVVHGVLVRDDDPDAQLAQVVERYELAEEVSPGSRCPRCNGRVVPVPRAQVLHELEPGTRAAGYDHFGRCTACDQLYWAGAHAQAIAAIVERAT